MKLNYKVLFPINYILQLSTELAKIVWVSFWQTPGALKFI